MAATWSLTETVVHYTCIIARPLWCYLGRLATWSTLGYAPSAADIRMFAAVRLAVPLLPMAGLC